MTVITTIIIITKEEQKDLFNCRYNILLIHCSQPDRALTLDFALCTQMPQKKSLGRGRCIGALLDTSTSTEEYLSQQNWL